MLPSCPWAQLAIFANPTIRRREWKTAKTSQLMIVLIIVASTMVCHKRCRAAPLEREGNDHQNGQQMDRKMALRYLHKFGHLNTQIPTPVELRNALETFQDMTGVTESGKIDENTLGQMRQSRCGNEDVSRMGGQRRRRFVYISRWEGKVNEGGELKLKWFVHNYTPDIPREEIRKTVHQAFNLWSSQVKIPSMESISLVFEEASSEEDADITILWAEGDHGDAHMFDGPGEEGSNILAHTFYPNYQFKGTLNGDIHLDDFEQWNVNNSRNGASFPHVLVHEIGHTLGLGHSKKQQAIMFPIYRKEQLDQMQLDMDDKCAINWSYVGATDLCLYVWLLSEVLPKKVAMEEAAMASATPSAGTANSESKQLSSNMLQQEDQGGEGEGGGGIGLASPSPSSAPKEALISAHLAGRPMPDCGPGPGGRMRHQLAELLRRRLSFPKEMATPYANIICRFFDGFRREFGLPSTRHLHQVIRPFGAHSYLQPNQNFLEMERALNRGEHHTTQFDAEFFSQLIATFLGEGKNEEEKSGSLGRRRK